MVSFILVCALLLFCVVLGLAVLLNNKRNAVNISFFFLASSLGLWFFFNYFADQQVGIPIVWTRLTFFFATYAIAFFALFSYLFPRGKFGKFGYFLLIVATIVACLSASPLVAQSVFARYTAGEFAGFNVNRGLLYPVYSIYIASFALMGVVILIRRYRKSVGHDKEKIKIYSIGAILSALLAVLLNLVIPIVSGSSASSRFGFLAALPILLLTSYAILRHRFLDIRAVVTRSLAFVFATVLLAGIYGLIAFQLISRILPTDISVTTVQAIYTVLAVILAFTFQPIRRQFEKLSNALFYRSKYDPQQLVTNIGHILAGEIRLDQLSHKVIHELSKQMKIATVDIVVLSEKNVHFQTRVFSTDHHEVIVSDLKKLGRLAVMADEISGGEKKAVMQKYGYSVSLALRTSEEFLGYLLLGEKKNGDIYNAEDIQTLKIIANELSVGLQNAKAFAEIQAFNVTLQQKVNEATKNLRKANEQLKDLDQAKDEFISMASHQLRTPLTTVKGYVSMLDEGDFGKITKEQHQPLEQALDGSNRMARLIDDLLNISRMEAGRFFIDAAKVDLNKVVPQEITQLQNMAKTKKVELTYIPPKKEIPIMHLDENKTRQVIMNLADNAVHYSSPPAGGGKVQVTLERDGNNIVYMVRDNGIGVPKDQQGKLFTKMFRARNAQEVRPDGTGLGLYLVKRVVEDQGGKIIFESEPGKGSSFGFIIPVHNKIVIDKLAQKKLASAHKAS